MTDGFRVFGFGSLMADGWEKQFACHSKEKATLPDYTRAFVKPSIKRWGSKENPAPTLDIERRDGARCEGMLFSFPDDQAHLVKAYLEKREGKDFPLHEVTLHLAPDRKVSAVVAIYAGKKRISGSAAEIAQMALKAVGEAGGGFAYIQSVAATLEEQGVVDSAVAAVMAEATKLMKRA
jgi:cation transport protein ChaC